MSKYILRWQRGLTNDEVKIQYTYGSKEMLEAKGALIAEDEKVLFVSLDKVEKVIKDTRTEELIKRLDGATL